MNSRAQRLALTLLWCPVTIACLGNKPSQDTVDSIDTVDSTPDTGAKDTHGNDTAVVSDSGIDTGELVDTVPDTGEFPGALEVMPEVVVGPVEDFAGRWGPYLPHGTQGELAGIVSMYGYETVVFASVITTDFNIDSPDATVAYPPGTLDADTDLDGDGFSDMFIEERMYRGPFEGALAPDVVVGSRTFVSDCNDGFPSEVITTKDVNGDGEPDVVFSNYNDPTGGGRPCPGYAESETPAGAAYILYGPVEAGDDLDAADVVILGNGDFQNLGIALTDVGDTNGDGLSDFQMLARGGSFHVFLFPPPFGPALGLSDAVFEIEDALGSSIGSASGDWNGDGYADIGTPVDTEHDENVFSVALCPCEGSVTPAGLPLRLSPPLGGHATFVAFSSAGDLNNDDRDDLVLGDDISGTTWVLPGGDSGVIDFSSASAYSLPDTIGPWSTLLAGQDFDGDSLNDVLITTDTYEGYLLFFAGADMPF